MNPTLFRSAATALALVMVAGCTADAPVPEGRLRSTYGYSIQPPTGTDWTEESGASEMMWLKKTDPARVSFFVGAGEHRAAPAIGTDAALLAYARKLTAGTGDDGSGRYSDVTSDYAIAPDQPTCVDYRIGSLDHGANNAGEHDALTMLTRGRFCVHPGDRTAAVNLFHSIRHAPGVDVDAMTAEGDAFLRSLVFDPLR